MFSSLTTSFDVLLDLLDLLGVSELDNLVLDGVVVLATVIIGSKEGGNDGAEGGDETSEKEGANRLHVGYAKSMSVDAHDWYKKKRHQTYIS